MPRRRFLAKHPVTGTQHKPALPHLQERSPYYWWWQYLRRNPDYLACCDAGGTGPLAALYADFGDVRSDDFREWWGGSRRRGPDLFAERGLGELKVAPVSTDEDWAGYRDAGNVLVVAVNLELGRRFLQKHFALLLAQRHRGKQGRPALGKVTSTARYPLYRNFNQHNLREMLRTYDAWAENQRLVKSQQKTLWQIGESINLVPTAMTRATDTKSEHTAKRNVMTVAVSRYVRAARNIIANTARGQFPNSEKPEVPPVADRDSERRGN
jgi:hypothetical protein